MARLFSRAEWRLAVAGTLTGVLTAALVLALWLRSPGGGGAVEVPVVTGSAVSRGEGAFVGALSGRVAERLAARTLPTRPLAGTLSLTARNVVWRDPDSGLPFARAASLVGSIDAAAANRRDIVLGTVVMDRLSMDLTSDGRTWNYERPMARLLSDEPPRPGEREVTFLIGTLRVTRGLVNVDMPERDFTLRDVEGRLATVQFAGPGLAAPRLEVVSASAALQMAGQEQSWALAAERGNVSFPERTTRFDLSAVSVAGIRVEGFGGVWDPSAPGYGVTATGRARDVQLASLEFLAPEQLPDTGNASFTFAVAPLAGDGTALQLTQLALVSGDSRMGGSLAVDVFPGQIAVERVALTLQGVALALAEPFTGPLPYAGTVTGTVEGPGADIRVDLVANMRAPDVPGTFSTRLTGGLALTRQGLSLQELRGELRQVPLAALRALAPGLPFAGTATGSVVATGAPRSAPLEVDVRLEVGTGVATVAGTLDLTGDVPRYDVSGRLVGIQLQSVLAPAVPPVALTANFAAAGTGFDPGTAEASVRLDGGFAGWRAEPGDTVSLVATAARGELRVAALTARLASASLEGDGSWRFMEPLSGAVGYRLAVSDLEPFGPYLPVVGDSTAAGLLRAEGTISGPLAGLRFAGSLRGSDLASGEWGAGQLEAEYAITRTSAMPDLELRLRGTRLRTPAAGDYEQLRADVRLASPVFALDVQGEQAGGAQVALVAEGTVPREGARAVQLQRAWFDLPEGRWELEAPARIDWGGDDGVRVTGLEFRNRATGGQLALEGRLLPLARFDGRLIVAGLPLEQLQDLLGRDRLMSGRLWADVVLRTPGPAPEIAGTFRLEQAVIEGVALSRLEGRLDYDSGGARTELTALFDSAGGRLDLNGTIPLRIALTDSVEVGLSEQGLLDASVRAERVSLRPLRLLLPRVRDLEGVLDGMLLLQGTADAPTLTGQLALTAGRVSVPELSQRFDSIGGVVAFSGRTAEIRDFRMRRDGWATLSGTARFEELDRPVLDLAIDLDGFRPIGVNEHPDAAFTGRVTVTGEPTSLVLSGRVLIDDGYLTVPQLGASYNPGYLDGIDATPVLGPDFGRSGGGNWVSNARIVDLVAVFGEGAWVEAFQATVQLSGQLTIDKAGDDIALTGTLSGTRGTYTLAAGPILRRFEITSAQVRFLGSPEPNPAINITARRVILDPDGRRVEVEVRITGFAQTPRLALASADAPNIPESELLSFLLFGRQNFALGETVRTTGEMFVEQTLFGGVAEFAGLELERALSANLGLQLDLFQVRFGQGFGGLTTPTFVLGRQLGGDFFLTVESGLNALFADAGRPASSWAVRLEWAIDPRQTLELGAEPLNRSRLLRGIGAALPPGRPSPRQIYGEYRRRWMY